MGGVKWKRETSAASGGSCYRVYNDGGDVILHVHRLVNCEFWYVFVGVDQDEAEGIRFKFLWEAKQYAERQIEKWRVSLEAESLTCRECQQEFTRDEVTDGVCEECNREECPTCEGTGYSDDDEDGADECEDCGGDGVI